MTVDFHKLWADPDTPNRERKQPIAHIIEDVTLTQRPAEGTTKVHVRFKGDKVQTLTTLSPKSSAQQVKTQPGIVALVDKLLNDHIYSEIAELLNQQGYHPGEATRLDNHEHTVARWAKHGLITSHAYNGHYCLYGLPVSDLPQKQCSRWNRLVDHAAARSQTPSQEKTSTEAERDVV